jgi:hypothetical protein
MDEVHEAERAKHRAERRAHLEAGDEEPVTIGERLTALRDAIDELQQDLEQGGTVDPATPVRRPTKGGRMRA